MSGTLPSSLTRCLVKGMSQCSQDMCSLVYLMFVTPLNNKIDYHIISRTSVTSFNLIYNKLC